MPEKSSERKWHELSFFDRWYINALGVSMMMGAVADLIFQNGKVTVTFCVIGAILGTILSIFSWRRDQVLSQENQKTDSEA